MLIHIFMIYQYIIDLVAQHTARTSHNRQHGLTVGSFTNLDLYLVL